MKVDLLLSRGTQFSEGARYDREATRKYLRRLIKAKALDVKTLNVVLNWVLTRQKRYGKISGGL